MRDGTQTGWLLVGAVAVIIGGQQLLSRLSSRYGPREQAATLHDVVELPAHRHVLPGCGSGTEH